MAYIDPNQAAQINQTLNAMKSTLQNISSGLSTLSPSAVQQIAPSLSSALSSAGSVLGTTSQRISSAPTPTQTPPAQQTLQQTSQSSQDQYTQGMQNLMAQMSQLLAKYQNPPTVDTSNISQIYGQTASDLKARYEKMLQDLQKKQQEDQQKLAGRYAAAGFSEPGILGGQAAGVPGVATEGMKELQSAQASDVTNLQQAEAGDLNALAAAQASAEQQAQQQAIENYYRQLQLMQSALEQQANLMAYKTPEQQLAEEIQKQQIEKQLGLYPYVKYEQPKVETIKEKDGSVWQVVYDNDGNIISKTEVLPSTPKETSTSELNKTALIRHLASLGLPLTLATENGELPKSALNKVVAAGVPLDVAEGIWANIVAGNSFEEIRQGIRSQGGDPSILDKFVQALQGKTSF